MAQDRKDRQPVNVEPGRYTSDDLDEIAAEFARRPSEATLDRNEADDLDREPDCEHGLSAWLCAGPMHYPEGM